MIGRVFTLPGIPNSKVEIPLSLTKGNAGLIHLHVSGGDIADVQIFVRVQGRSEV